MSTRRAYPPTESDLPLHNWFPYSGMHQERIRAHELHKDKPSGSMEMKDHDDPRWLGVLMEELGEVADVLNDYAFSLMSEDERDRALSEELNQLGAMAAAWLDAIKETRNSRHNGWDPGYPEV